MIIKISENKYKIRGTKVVMPYSPELTPAECRLVFGLQKIFDSRYIMVDVYLPKPDSKKLDGRRQAHLLAEADLAQIDCLAMDQRGIFVFESKDYVGWIYGHGDRVHWTQVSAYGKNKHQFYSPVRQNQAHVEAVKGIFGGLVPVYSVIVFGNDANLKVVTDLPECCYVGTQVNLGQILAKVEGARFSEAQMEDIWGKLEASRVHPSTIVRGEHVEEIAGRDQD